MARATTESAASAAGAAVGIARFGKCMQNFPCCAARATTSCKFLLILSQGPANARGLKRTFGTGKQPVLKLYRCKDNWMLLLLPVCSHDQCSAITALGSFMVHGCVCRDHAAWCPYCQKVWIQLEEKQIPYEIEKINMRCYGDKPAAYTAKVVNLASCIGSLELCSLYTQLSKSWQNLHRRCTSRLILCSSLFLDATLWHNSLITQLARPLQDCLPPALSHADTTGYHSYICHDDEPCRCLLAFFPPWNWMASFSQSLTSLCKF